MPTKDIIACPKVTGKLDATCSGLEECPNNCILFGVKKSWLRGGYGLGLESDEVIR